MIPLPECRIIRYNSRYRVNQPHHHLKRPYDIILAGIVILLADLAAAAKGEEQSTSPYATAADLVKYAMKLRGQALLKVEPPVFVPTSSRPAIQRFPWKTNIVTTVFWVGEQA